VFARVKKNRQRDCRVPEKGKVKQKNDSKGQRYVRQLIFATA
jgi:hypothetical protein